MLNLVTLDTAEKELRAFMQLELAGVTDSLMWWKNTSKFPRLKRLALAILHVPATSALIERTFSRSGYLMRPQSIVGVRYARKAAFA